MSFSTTHFVPFPREDVWEWHTRAGAVTRLTPPFAHMYPVSVTDSLARGTTTFALPGGLRWVARHDLTGYREGHNFVDVCVSAPIKKFAGWRHQHSFSDAPGGTLITDTVTTRVPSATVRSLFAYRQHQLLGDLATIDSLTPLLGAESTPPVVALTGSRGLVGRSLMAFLQTMGITVIQLVRSKPKPGQRLWDPHRPDRDLLAGVDALIHLAGEPIFGRFSESHKQAIYESRVRPTSELARLVSQSPTCKSFIVASAIGYYGPTVTATAPAAEDHPKGSGFLAEVVADWEAAAAEVQARVVHVRTGVVLSGRGGLLPVFKTLFSAGLGGTLGSGTQNLSWIAIDDLVGIYTRALLDPSWRGPINAVAPHPVTNAEFSKIIAGQLRRPSFIPIPTLGPRILLGSEGTRELVLADQIISPSFLANAGFNFRYPELTPALAHELGGEELLEKV
ncbi:TIGR01777 family oxidoreductase [Corynebacterium epidermidicanis]|uniref:Putative TIGR01777 family protein n=1 Tax=Corynebacterium epidermidicanis TaxID=1050174 RepID=A0A0G3GPW7_9CORY|nr:TIGR01777 family oxidoreductase [Corynebacterium epidermidicanis]AKK03241.1 putative TIGR01777 family protein [Corynebacterium epidermidicanis]